MAASQFQLLKTRRFLPLFIVQFLAAFNDNVFKNALVILLAYQAGDKAGIDPRILITASAGIFILPFFLFSATAGQLADKYEKSRLIRLTRLLEIPVMLIAAFGFATENYWLLMSVLFGAGVLAAFFGPLKYSILPEHLEQNELIGGNALVEAGTFVAILLGTIFGGILVLLPAGMLIISCTVVGIAAASWLVSQWVPPARSVAGNLTVRKNIAAAAWSLVRHAYSEKSVFMSIIGISWFWLVGFTFLAQFPVYASRVLGANEQIVTLFLTVFSMGIALGSLFCNKLLKGKVSSAYVPRGALWMSLGIFLLWAVTPAAIPHDGLIDLAQFLADPVSWLILFSLMIISMAGGVYIVPLYAIMQTRSEASHRSRTIAVNNIMNALFMVLGALLTIVMLKVDINITEIFLLIGLTNLPVIWLSKRHI